MFGFIYKTSPIVRSAVRHSQSHSIYFLRIPPNAKSLQSITTSTNQHLFAASYLINSCGFPPDKAISASRDLKFEAPDKPDSVLAFLKSQGFTETQISSIVRTCPRVLLCDREKTLLPKIEFLKSEGMSRAVVTKILSKTPQMFRTSLEKRIIPSFEFFNNFFQSNEKTIASIKHHGWLFLSDPKIFAIPKIEILQVAGMPKKNIAYLLTWYPRVFQYSSNKLREILVGVQKMGFNPLNINFMVALKVTSSMSKSVWKKKLEVYKKWGWSEEDSLVAFVKYPWTMMASEGKIMRIMDYLVNKMGLDSSCIQRKPRVIGQSLEKRIIPRCELHKVLLSKGLINRKNYNLLAILICSEERFLKILNSHGEEFPNLLKLYKEKLTLAK